MIILIFTLHTLICHQFCHGTIKNKLAIDEQNCLHELPRQSKHLNKLSEMNDAEDNLQCSSAVFDNASTLHAFIRVMHTCRRRQMIRIANLVVELAPNRQIIDSTFAIFKINKLLSELSSPSQLFYMYLTFLNLKGFDIDSRIDIERIASIKFYSHFNLYHRNKLVTGCREFDVDSTSTTRREQKQRGFVFSETDDRFLDLVVHKPAIKHPICALFFRHALLDTLTFEFMAQSFFMRHMVSFINPNTTTTTKSLSINSTIKELIVDNSYGVVVDHRLLNAAIFANTSYFTFVQHVASIDEDVFRTFTSSLKSIKFDALNLIRVIRQQGIEWIRSINAHLSVDLANRAEIKAYRARFVKVIFDYNRDFLLHSAPNFFAYDRDFCLFAHFPFKQLVYLSPSLLHAQYANLNNKNKFFSCTEVWLNRFYEYMPDMTIGMTPTQYKAMRASNFTSCQFERRLELCDKKTATRYEFKKSKSEIKDHDSFSSFDFWIAFEFGLIVVAPILAAYASFTNLLAVYVIYHEANKKTSREKHYVYMSLHCIANSLICFIQIASLVSECQQPFGLFCSSIRTLVGAQYITMVFDGFLNSTARLVSNFAYLGFSLCRMHKVGKDHGNLIVLMNKLSIKSYMCVWVLASAGLSVCKSLQFSINLNMPELSFPWSFFQNPDRMWLHKPSYVGMVVVNSVCDLINYLAFPLCHFVVDMVLVKKLRSTLKEKEDKMREMRSQALEKTLRENSESRRRIVSMVILSSLFNFITKTPSTITSLNDLRLFILDAMPDRRSDWFDYNPMARSLSFRLFCSSEKSCVTFKQFGNCLFLLSLCLTIHFLKKFDKNFEIAYRQVFSSSSSSSTGTKAT